MSELSDDILKRLFQHKLREYESMPSLESWDAIQKKLPRTRTGFTWSTNIIITSLIIGSLLITGSSVRITPHVSGSPAEISSNKMQTILPGRKDAVSQSGPTIQPEVENLNEDNDTSSHQMRTVVHTTKIKSDLDSNSKVIGTSIAAMSMNDSSHTNVSDVRYPYLSNETFARNTTTEELEQEREFGVNVHEVEVLLPIDSSIQHSDSLTKVLQHEKKYAKISESNLSKSVTGYYVLKVTPFYNSGVFNPFSGDNIRVSNFSQASNLIRNRLGLALEIGYHHSLSGRIDVEYAIGYKVFSKEFEYTTSTVNAERGTDQVVHHVSSQNHILKTSVNIKPSFQPLALSVSYEKVFGSFTSHIGSHLLNLGLNAQKSLGRRIFIRPGMSYGFSIGGETKHFVYKPIGWNLEVVWKLTNRI